jgi:hypothetical protein
VADVRAPSRLLEGEKAGSEVAEAVAAMPRPGLAFWTAYCDLRCAAQSACASAQGAERPVSPKRARECRAINHMFERAVLEHGEESAKLWLRWIRFLEDTGEDSGLVVRRAVAALPQQEADALTLALRRT